MKRVSIVIARVKSSLFGADNKRMVVGERAARLPSIMDAKKWATVRARLLDRPDELEALERRYTDLLARVVQAAAPTLHADFARANELLPFWLAYAPKPRGRAPTGTSIPWSEVGEKSLSSNLVAALKADMPEISFPGLPFGGDVRFATSDAFIHFDVKMTGPNDRTDEVVAPPQQLSGDGALWSPTLGAMRNSSFTVTGQRAGFNFQPKLPPFYELDGTVRVCLTFFLKAVYQVEAMGVQPLHYMEVACVPNGLLLFDGPRYADRAGFLIPGKDDKTKAESDRRTRVRLDPLVAIGAWRCQQVVRIGETWEIRPRPKPLVR